MSTTKHYTKKSAIITSVIGLLANLCLMCIDNKNEYTIILVAMGQALLFAIGVVVIIVMAFIKRVRPYINGIWIGLGLNLLIGFAMCTTMLR